MLLFNPIEEISRQKEIQQKVQDLSLKDKEILLGWLKAEIKEQKKQATSQQIPLQKGREVVETQHAGTTLYRLEKVKCGKKKCKCSKGDLHGPYWYAYHWKGKKMTSSYIGKNLDEAFLEQIENQNSSTPKE